MINYFKDEIPYYKEEMRKLSNLISEEKMNVVEKLALSKIMEIYNDNYNLAKEMQIFIKRKINQFNKESDNNDKLLMQTRNQKQKIIGLEERVKVLVEENKDLNKKLRLLLEK